MIRILTVLVLAQAVSPAPRPRVFRTDGPERLSRLGSDDYAMFEFAPASGAGMGTACACLPVTGAKGETLTYTRTASTTCTKGNVLTNIADGDLVVCPADRPLVMPGNDGTGPLGILMEGARVNRLIQSAELCNVAWSDVGTPTCDANALIGPFNTLTMERITDDDGAAKEGRSQPASTTNQTKHTGSCYVKAGTADSVTISMVGTGNSAGDCSATFTGLSTTTSTRAFCTSPAAYGAGLTAVTVSILVGSTVGVTGSVYVEACQHEAASPLNATSYIPTTTATVTRGNPSMLLASSTSSTTISMAATIVPDWTTTSLAEAGAPGIITMNGANGSSLYISTNLRFLTGATANPSSAVTSAKPVRVYGYDNGTNAVNSYGVNTNSVATGAAANRFGTSIGIGTGAPAGVNLLAGVIKQVCIDTNPLRCR